MHLFFSVGEPSGDQHAAHLIRELRRRRPGVRCVGFGGEAMRAAGCDLHFRLTDMAVMGIFVVVPLLWKVFKLLRQAKRYFEEQRPDAVVMIDFSGFNWWIAKYAKRAGVRTIFYVPPQLWAWKESRIERIRRHVDDVLCCLPFEPAWYAARGVKVEYVGHPFFDEVAEHSLDGDFVESWSSSKFRNVAILPGSRDSEVRHNFPIMVEVMRRLHERHPQVRFLVACYKETHREFCQKHLQSQGSRLPVQLFVGKTPEVIQVGECCLMVSGSVSLEVLARGKPAAVIYWCDWPMYLIGRTLVKVKYASLPNLFVDREVMPEFLFIGRQTKLLTPLTEVLHGWLSVDERLKAARDEMAELRERFVQTGATRRVAAFLLQRLEPASDQHTTDDGTHSRPAIAA
jgi:lipid-A-disaccharide synthase